MAIAGLVQVVSLLEKYDKFQLLRSERVFSIKTLHVKRFSGIQGKVGAGMYPEPIEASLAIEVVDNYQAGVALPDLDIFHRLIS